MPTTINGTTGVDQIQDGVVSTAAKLASSVVTAPKLAPSVLSNSLGADVALNNTGLFFTGPSVAQGTVGTWFVSGSVVVGGSASPVNIAAKLWDGTTLIASGWYNYTPASGHAQIHLSGMISAPAGNLRISVKASQTDAKIHYNVSGEVKDSTITAVRIG